MLAIYCAPLSSPASLLTTALFMPSGRHSDLVSGTVFIVNGRYLFRQQTFSQKKNTHHLITGACKTTTQIWDINWYIQFVTTRWTNMHGPCPVCNKWLCYTTCDGSLAKPTNHSGRNPAAARASSLNGGCVFEHTPELDIRAYHWYCGAQSDYQNTNMESWFWPHS